MTDNRPLAIIFDRDGTLAAVHNGPSHSKVDTGDYRRATDSDWAAFNASIRFDAPVPEVVALLKAIRPGVVRIMVSGRAEGGHPGDRRLAFAMRDWVDKYELPIDYIFQREGGDKRLDSIVKEEILVTKILPRFNPVLAVDDRPAILEVWKKYGIATLQVHNPGTLPPIAFQSS